MKDTRRRGRAKARQWLEEASKKGVEGELHKVLDDTYDSRRPPGKRPGSAQGPHVFAPISCQLRPIHDAVLRRPPNSEPPGLFRDPCVLRRMVRPRPNRRSRCSARLQFEGTVKSVGTGVITVTDSDGKDPDSRSNQGRTGRPAVRHASGDQFSRASRDSRRAEAGIVDTGHARPLDRQGQSRGTHGGHHRAACGLRRKEPDLGLKVARSRPNAAAARTVRLWPRFSPAATPPGGEHPDTSTRAIRAGVQPSQGRESRWRATTIAGQKRGTRSRGC